MLQSVDWGAVAFGVVLVELDGKNATKDTSVRHLLAAQGHAYQLVKSGPCLCENSEPKPCTIAYPEALAACSLWPAARSPSSPGTSGITGKVTSRRT